MPDSTQIVPKTNHQSIIAILLTLFILLILLTGCGQKGPGENTPVHLDSVIFTRTGVYLQGGHQAGIQEVSIEQDGQALAHAAYPAPRKTVLMDLDWQPGTRYELKAVTNGGPLETAVYAPGKPSAVKLAEIPLEDLDKGEMEYLYYAWRGAQVRFSPDGNSIGVGSKGGYVYLISVPEKRIMWSHKIPEGRVAKVAFTDDGRLVAAEESCDGNVYCFDVATGKVLWTYCSADHFKGPQTGITQRGMFKNYPFMGWGLRIDKQNNPYVMVRQTYEKTVDGRQQSITTSLVSKLDTATGKPIWTFPINGSAWGLTLSEDGRTIFPAIGWAKTARLSVLDTATGKPLWQHTFTCPQGQASRWGTGFEGDMSPDGHYLVINQISPNVTHVFNNAKSTQTGQAELLWQKQFFKPLDVGGVPIDTHSIHLNLTQSEIIFSTYSARTMSRSANPSASPAQHPDADTLFVYDYEGRLKWKWKMGDGTWNSESALAADESYLVIPLGIVPANTLSNPEDMGAYVFNLKASGGATAKLNWFYHTSGFAYKSDISPDGRHIVVLEGPYDIDPDPERENIVGRHRLLILT